MSARDPGLETVRQVPFTRRAVYGVYGGFVLSILLDSMLYFRTGPDRDSIVSLSRVLGLLLFGLALIHRRLCFRRIPASFWLLAWYLAAFTLSQLWLPAALDAKFREQQGTLLQSAALFLISFNLLLDPDFRSRLLRLYGWGACLTALALLLGAFGGPPDGQSRSTILFQNANVSAALFGFGALCVAGDPRMIGSGRSLAWALPSAAAVAVLVAAVLRTGSRGGLLSLAGGVVGLAVCGERSTRAARLMIASLIVGLLGALLVREFRAGTETAARLELSWSQGDTAGRTGIYDAGWSMFRERPLLGYGGVNNRYILGTYMNRSDRDGRDADRDTHNVFLAVLTEVGLVGGIPFIAALFLALWRAWSSGRRMGDGLPFALMCALMIINMSTTLSRGKIFWIVLAAAFASGSRKVYRPSMAPR